VNAKWKLALITVSSLAAIGVTVSLGFWQLSRAAQKRAAQHTFAVQTVKAPLTEQALRSVSDWSTVLHQTAQLQGVWLSQATVYLDNRPMNGRVGYIVATPLLLQGGKDAILVQRGWAPRDFQDRMRLPRVDTPAGLVAIEGRIEPAPSRFYEPGPPSAGAIRQNIDLEHFKAETGQPLLGATVRQIGVASEGLLREWAPLNLGIEKNQGYALQWFGIATLIAVLFLWFQVIRRFIYRPQESISHAP